MHQRLLRFWRLFDVVDAFVNAEAEVRRRQRDLADVEARCLVLRPVSSPAA